MKIIYDHKIFSKESISLAFSIANKLNSQCVAMDLIYDKNGKELGRVAPRLVSVNMKQGY